MMGGEIFSQLMGGGGFAESMFGVQQRRTPSKCEDSIHSLKCTLEELYNGKNSKMEITRKVICSKCKGIGGKPGTVKPCRTCEATGIKVTLRQIGPGMIQQLRGVCPTCKGEREVFREQDRCGICKGKKLVEEQNELDVHVPRGACRDKHIILAGQGDQQVGLSPGDVQFVVQQEPHEVYQRHGHDLVRGHTLGIVEALCGFELRLRALDGRSLYIKHPAGQVIPHGCTKTVYGEGMPIQLSPGKRGNQRFGNLHIKFFVEFPETDYHFEHPEKYKEIEAYLPKRDPPSPSNFPREDAKLVDFVEDMKSDDEDDDDDDRRGHGGPSNVQCAHQ